MFAGLSSVATFARVRSLVGSYSFFDLEPTLRIMSIALGGCLRPPPLPLGITEDSGGHLTYLWGAAEALAARLDETEVELVTRLYDAPDLGAD